MSNYTIPLSAPCLDGNEAAYVADAIARNEIAIGEYIGRFERMVADYTGARYAVAVCSGTAALHLALLAAGVGPGDEVIVPALTFIATANAVSYCGADPVFVDVEPEYWGMFPTKLALFASQECHLHGYLWHAGRQVKAILPVHLLGHPANMDFIARLAAAKSLAVVEDATEALGAEYRGRKVGALGHLACLSFNGNKTVTTGGGGMVLTGDETLAARVRYLANQAKDDPVEYRHEAIGYNYRMSNLAAAIGCAQMERIAEKLAAKRRIAESYGRELAGVPGLTLPREAPWARSSWWLYTVLVDEREYGMGSRQLMARLAEAGIESRPLWEPIPKQGPYRRFALPGGYPVAERAWRDGLSLPSSVGMTEAELGRVAEVVRTG